jgi:UDP:flavonoid glycosyltransferase YjiC (YdhE family)
MVRFLAYVDAVPGRLYPLVPTLLELSRRGHHVVVKAGVDDVNRLRTAGLEARSLAPPVARFEPDGWKAPTRFGARMSGLRPFDERAPSQAADRAATIDAEHPDVLLIDEGSWGAAAVAEVSGLPWAFFVVSAVPLTSRDAPPFGLGLRPRHDRVGCSASTRRAATRCGRSGPEQVEVDQWLRRERTCEPALATGRTAPMAGAREFVARYSQSERPVQELARLIAAPALRSTGTEGRNRRCAACDVQSDRTDVKGNIEAA